MKDWFYMKEGDDMHVHYEDGTMERLAPVHYVLPFGKYKGLTLAEVNDVSYLRWLTESDLGVKDWFLSTCGVMRLKELSS